MKYFRKILLLVFLYLFLCSYASSQEDLNEGLIKQLAISKTDSAKDKNLNKLLKLRKNEASRINLVKQLLNKSTADTAKAFFLNKLASLLKGNLPDSALIYAFKVIELSKHENFPNKFLAKAYNKIGNIYQKKGDLKQAEIYYNKSLDIFRTIPSRVGQKGMADCFNNLATTFQSQGSYKKAIELFIESLKLRKKLKTEKYIAILYNNLGYCYLSLKDTQKAKEYFNKSLKIKIKLKRIESKAYSYNNLGDVELFNNNFKKAREYYQQALEIRKKYDNKGNLAYTYESFGALYLKEAKYDKALAYFDSALVIYKKAKLKGVAKTYQQMAELYVKKKDFKNAVSYSKKTIEIATKNRIDRIISKAYRNLAYIYESQNKSSLALKYYKLYVATKDTIYSNDNKKQSGYLNQLIKNLEKQDEIEKQKLELLKNNEITKRQRIQTFAFIGGLIFMFILLFVSYLNIRNKKKANLALNKKNNEIKSQKEEIEQQGEELLQSNNILLTQKKEITDSIYYAEHIQNAILPKKEFIQDALKDAFVFFKPRDIVSGDFYWIQKIKNFTIVAAADCTGHGVPGAFLSMLGSSYFNEIVTSRSLDNAGLILNKLRSKIKTSLHQKVGGDSKDGMDVALYVIDNETFMLQYAGAYNPLYVIRNEFIEDEKITEIEKNKKIKIHKTIDKQTHIIELKADRQPVAIHISETDFTNVKFQLKKNDCIYVFSDGFVDQFGGDLGKKLKPKRFKEVLLSVYKEPMQEQCELLGKKFEEWKGEFKQVDDVLVIGQRIV